MVNSNMPASRFTEDGYRIEKGIYPEADNLSRINKISTKIKIITP